MAIVEKKARLHKELLLHECTEVIGATAFVLAAFELGISQGIASGARHEEIDLFLARFKLQECIPQSRIVAKGDYRHSKPNAEPFELAFQALGLPDEARGNVLAFEDGPMGVESAKRTGLTVVALTTRHSKETLLSREYTPDFVVPDFTHLRLAA